MRILLFISYLSFLFSFNINADNQSNYKNSFYQTGNVLSSNIKSNNQILDKIIDESTYLIGSGDVFLFNMITTNGVSTLELVVSPTGDVLIPLVGKVNLKNEILENAYAIMTQKCKEKYEDAFVYINLIELRKFKVLVTGTSEYAGMHINSSNNRVSDLIESIYSFTYLDTILNQHLFDYPKNIMISKDITLIRNDSLISINLFDYYINGNNSQNPILIEEDIINIKNTNKITVLGVTHNPGLYLYEENKTVYDYILKTGAYNSISKTIYVLDINSGSKIRVNKKFIPKSGSIIFIDEKIDYKWERKWDRIKDLITITSSLTSILLVLSNLSGNN